MTSVEDLSNEIKSLIIETLDLEDVEPKDIDESAPLFGDGLGLDSIDALELGVSLQSKYNLRLDSNDQKMQEYFRSIETLVQLVLERRVENVVQG
ncbi:MAG: phosphopantetheine-binding protein [Thalassobaculaceae bacterium]|nr:phosphopantetheine-binding protein [Thalassobaculaceae bacterium]